jgi:hypothetical protein
MMRLALALVAAVAACSDPPPVTGVLMDQPFVARGGYFANDAGTEMHLYDYNYCGVLGSPIEHAPVRFIEVDMFFDQLADAPQQFTLNPGHVGDGLDAPAAANMNVYNNATAFTGGTISLDTVSADELTGSLVMTTADGDYVQGNFRVTDCAGP